MTTKLLRIRWPELKKEVLVEPLKANQMLFDWFLENTPVKAIQGHAVVSGKHLYCLSVPFKKHMPANHPKWETVRRDEAPIGTVGIFVGKGYTGSILIKYGKLTEIAYYPGVLGHVAEQDLETLKEVGKSVWDAIYNTKQIITFELEEA